MKVNDILLGAAELLKDYCANEDREDCDNCYFNKEDGRCRIGYFNKDNEPRVPCEWELEDLKDAD